MVPGLAEEVPEAEALPDLLFVNRGVTLMAGLEVVGAVVAPEARVRADQAAEPAKSAVIIAPATVRRALRRPTPQSSPVPRM